MQFDQLVLTLKILVLYARIVVDRFDDAHEPPTDTVD